VAGENHNICLRGIVSGPIILQHRPTVAGEDRNVPDHIEETYFQVKAAPALWGR
jgi:hypothetical protein